MKAMWTTKRLGFLAIALLAIGFIAYGGYRATAVRPSFADITYSKASLRNALDIYLSPKAAKPQPLVVHVHGGGFQFGDKARPANLQDLLEAGFAVAAINYRLSGEAIWPAQLIDVTDAIRFLHANASRYGVDPKRMAIFGQSAGAHLAVTATSKLTGDGEPYIRAAVDWFGPIDFSTMDADMAATGLGATDTDGAASFESRLIGAAVGDNPGLARQASPLHFIDQLSPEARLPPILIMHGAMDRAIAARQSERLRDAIAASPASGGVRLDVLPGGTHGGGDFREPEAIAAVVAFLRRELARGD